MGGSEPENEVHESQLSKEQAKVLEAREELYQEYMLPELKNYYKQSKSFELNNKYANLDSFAELADSNNQQAFNTAKSSVSTILNQRGLNSDQVQNQIDVQANRVGSRTHNNATLQQILQHNNIVQKQNANTLNQYQVNQAGVNMLMSQAGTPTQAAPVFFHQNPGKEGLVAQIGKTAMGAMGSMGSMGGGMGGMFGGGGSS